MPPKTLNYRLQQTAGAGRLARNRGSSGPPLPMRLYRSREPLTCSGD